MMCRRSEESVQQTASVLNQYLLTSVTGPRRLVGRSLYTLNTINNTHQSLDQAKNLLLMSQLPPELSISSGRGLGAGGQFSGLGHLGHGAGHSPLGRTVSDSHTKLLHSTDLVTSTGLTRRKLENEDSSYDSDHEQLTGTLSVETRDLGHLATQSHDDVSRTHSETLAQVCGHVNTDKILFKYIPASGYYH